MRCGAVPADDVRRDLVADQEGADRRVIPAGLDHVRDGAPDGVRDLLRVEEADVLRPRDPDEDPEVALGGHVEQPAGRGGEEPEAVGPQLGHQGEVPLDDVGGGISIAIRVRGKRAVGDPPERNLVISSEEELPAHFQPGAGAGGLRAPDGARPRVEPHGPNPPWAPPEGAHNCVRFETLGGCARSDIQGGWGAVPRRAPGTEVPETSGILHGETIATAMPVRVIVGGRRTLSEVVIFQLVRTRKMLRGPDREGVCFVFTRPQG